MSARRCRREIMRQTSAGPIRRCLGPCGQWLPCDGEHFSSRKGRNGNTEWRSRCRACERAYERARKARQTVQEPRGAVLDVGGLFPGQEPPALSWTAILGPLL